MNYILPLLTLPYLVKTLGIDYFGLLAFATATIAYFAILTDYGFNLTATKEISMNREEKAKVVEIFSSVMSIKFFLLILSFLLLSLLILSFELFSKHFEIYLLSFGSVIGQFLFPVWFFQGMEKMRYITYLNLISKSIFTLAIFVFVEEKEDVYLVPLFFSLGAIIAGILSLYIIYKEFNVYFKFQKTSTLKMYLIEGWHVFLSRFYVSLYTTTNLLLLGLFTNNLIVGYYAIAEKIVLAIAGIFEPLNQTLYPYLARKYKDDFNLFVLLLKRIALLFIVSASIFLLLSEYFIEHLVYLIHGSYEPTIILLLSIFLLRVLSYPYGGLLSNTLIIMKETRNYMKVMNYTVLLNFLTVPLASYFFNAMGLIIAFLCVTFIHVFLLWYYVQEAIHNQRRP
ncbi:MAG: Membrane protein involved in the export of O-antigen, teichoic acid lipoteichoic acids [uncultured Sulfurovum sp.]|uniref:Membrane protein involved in the export of O-antigen, teichoic acid lipoteichoic acids n=1 Tax=uncultured Sulfurovum sp. TaxID=269237 RepID=A0A6S6T5T4_9BACT|nr:MAG: Membrane protein involved in the export of O-antigen, teichoic acid lipoteichoic acids [uncultured Sulfurovum sp.]